MPRCAGADLSGAALSGARLAFGDFTKANLKRADLREANLHNATLERADLTQADLRGTDLRRANLTSAKLDHVRFDDKTQWPLGFDPPTPPSQPSSVYKTRVRLGSLVVQGACNTEAIEATLVKNRGRFLSCYTRAHSNDPSLRGSLTLHFQITEKGDTLPDVFRSGLRGRERKALVRCVGEVVQKLEFVNTSKNVCTAKLTMTFGVKKTKGLQ